MIVQEYLDFLKENVTDKNGHDLYLVNAPVIPILTHGILKDCHSNSDRSNIATRLTLLPFSLISVRLLLQYVEKFLIGTYQDFNPALNIHVNVYSSIFKSAYFEEPVVNDIYRSVTYLLLGDFKECLKTKDEVFDIIHDDTLKYQYFAGTDLKIVENIDITNILNYKGIDFLTPRKFVMPLDDFNMDKYILEVLGFVNKLYYILDKRV